MDTRPSAEDLIKLIHDLIRENWKSQEDPDTLSQNIGKIADLNWNLGQYLAEFEEMERAMKAELEVDKATIVNTGVDAGDSVAKSEVRATIQLAPKRVEYNKIASNLEKVKITMRANQSVIDAARSRLSLIKEQIK